MGNVFNLFSSKPKPVVIEEAIEVFGVNPSAEVIEVDLVEHPVQYELS
tara:strand:- start:273 stop:416 length:144 start_codon:yes stop_codon:yes gene_type:complete